MLIVVGGARKSSASVLAAAGMFAAYGILSRSLALSHHARMQANAVSQRAAWVLLPRPLICSVSDAYRGGWRKKIQRICVGGSWGVWVTKQELRDAALFLMLANGARAESCVGAIARPLICSAARAVLHRH